MAVESFIRLALIFLGIAVSEMVEAKAYADIPGFGRNLIIRNLPPVPDFQSNLYEVYMEPFLYDTARPPLQALAVIGGDAEGTGGELLLSQWAPGGPVLIEGNVTGLTAGAHGLHITQRGDLRNGCESTGRHFNPFMHRHGGPRDNIRHVGDLGNVRAGDDGVARVRVVDGLISLTGPRSVVGRSVVVTEREDDLGRASSEDSALNGSSGRPVMCGIIGYL